MGNGQDILDRRHPDIFTAAEALAYLHAATGTERTLETLRTTHKLPSSKIGYETVYHRAHLDALVLRIFGLDQRMRAKPVADKRQPESMRLVGT